MYSALIHEIVLPSSAFVRPPTTKRSSSTTTREPQIRRARARVRRRHGVRDPGHRFASLHGGADRYRGRARSCVVSRRLLARRRGRGRRRDDSAVADPPQPRTSTPRPEPPLDAFLGVGAAERARARERRRCTRARAAAETAARLVDAPRRPAPPRLVWEPSAPKTTVVPILPRLDPAIVGDEWGHPTQTAPRDPNITQAPKPPTAVGWREVAVDDAGASGDSSSLARQPGASSDFVRGSLANVPFTPGGAGWETAAAEASAAREASARHASVGWLAEYEAGVFSGTPPGFDPSPWADPPAAAEANRDVDHDRDRAAALTHDDLLLDAIRGANVEDAASPDEDDSDDSDDSDETSDDDASDDDASAERPRRRSTSTPRRSSRRCFVRWTPRGARGARRARLVARRGRTPAGISGR